MTITKLRSIPRELPHARIYLDDLFEIEDVLRSAAMRLPSPVNIRFEYVVDRSIRMTTREELIEHGGRSSEFELRLITDKGRDTGVLHFIGMGHIQFDLPYTLENQEWEIYGRVAQILSSRSNRLKRFAEAIPHWVGSVAGIWSICYFLSIGLMHRNFNVILFWSILSPLLIPTIIGAVGIWQKNRIYLYYARPNQKERKEAWKARFEKFVWLIIGLAIGLLFDRLKR